MPKAKFTAAGDAIITRLLPETYEGFEEIRDEILRGDFRFFNLETTVHDNRTFGGRNSGGGWLCSPPRVLDAIKEFGFNVTTPANNHSLDFMYEGLIRTIEHLDRAGIASSGTGRTLQEAARPCYLDFPHARIALISASASFQPEARAGEQNRYLPGRPGLNALGSKVTYSLPESLRESFEAVADASGANIQRESLRKEGYLPEPGEGVYEIGTLAFRFDGTPGPHSSAEQKDLERIKREIYEAELQADYIVISIHSHETDTGDRHDPAEFLVEFAHAVIDAGAHAVVGHGPHMIRPIEIYKKRPIFYSLGDIIFHNENLVTAPADFFDNNKLDANAAMRDLFGARSGGFTRGLQYRASTFETFIPYWEMEDGVLTSLSLLAVELGYGLPRSRSGWPVPAKDDAILRELGKLSEPYGTRLRISGNRATVELQE